MVAALDGVESSALCGPVVYRGPRGLILVMKGLLKRESKAAASPRITCDLIRDRAKPHRVWRALDETEAPCF